MRIELFGIARARAGTAEVEIDADSVGAALSALAERHPALCPEVLTASGRPTAAYLLSLNGERFVEAPETPLRPDDTLLLLGAQAGG